jgi:hypothetical protein
MKAQDATIEQILSDTCCWEDPDSAIIIMPANKEGSSVYISSYNGDNGCEAATLREALIGRQLSYFSRSLSGYHPEYYSLDWTDLIEAGDSWPSLVE